MEEEKVKPEHLEYATPRAREPLDQAKVVKLGAAMMVPLIVLVLWSWFGAWCFGRKHLDGYGLIFVYGPLCIGTLEMGLGSLAVLVVVIQRRLPVEWLVEIVFLFGAWFCFAVLIVGMQDGMGR